VTDANLVLGRISPDLGGKFQLDRDAAEKAIDTVAQPLGMSTAECAEGILEILGESMAGAIRMVSSDRGRDPRDHIMVAFGGAGGLHAFETARGAGVERVVVPPYAGVACAFGAITMDVRHDLEATFYSALEDIDMEKFNASLSELETRARDLLASDGANSDTMIIDRYAAMRYVGQSYEVTTPLPSGDLTQGSLEAIKNAFFAEHQREYGVYSTEFPVAVVNIRVTGVGVTPKPADDAMASTVADGTGEPRRRSVFFDGEFVEVDVYDSTSLRVQTEINGPSVIEQDHGVVVVPPDARAIVDRYGNVLLESKEQNNA
jgi:N-methylhydantoinase A